MSDKLEVSARLTIYVAHLMEQAVKFILPNDGFLFSYGTPTEKDLDLFRMPYQIMACEFMEGSNRVILLAVDKAEFFCGYVERFDKNDSADNYLNGPEGCVIVPFINDKNIWTPFWEYYIVYHDRRDGFQSLKFGEFGRRFNDAASVGDGLTAEYLALLGQGYVVRIIQLCCAMNCSNVVVESDPAPAALNKKRAAKGKLPLFEYKTLKIEVPRETAKRAHQGGTHASPRLHIRRGHIRHMPEKAVWVNACMVGNKARGAVEKDYRVVSAGGRQR